MSHETPDDRRYLESHEWARVDGDVARVGISDFAQDELGDVVFVELLESITAVSDLYAPVSGTGSAVNDDLESHPERVNEDPYGEGWLLEVEVDDADELDALLDADGYRAQTE